MKTLFVICAIICALLTSCSHEAQEVQLNREGISNIGEDVLVRAKDINTGDITPVTLSYSESFVYRTFDSVWINLDTHRITQTDNDAGNINVRVVLLKRTDY